MFLIFLRSLKKQCYIFQLFRLLKVTGHYIFSASWSVNKKLLFLFSKVTCVVVTYVYSHWQLQVMFYEFEFIVVASWILIGCFRIWFLQLLLKNGKRKSKKYVFTMIYSIWNISINTYRTECQSTASVRTAPESSSPHATR